MDKLTFLSASTLPSFVTKVLDTFSIIIPDMSFPFSFFSALRPVSGRAVFTRAAAVCSDTGNGLQVLQIPEKRPAEQKRLLPLFPLFDLFHDPFYHFLAVWRSLDRFPLQALPDPFIKRHTLPPFRIIYHFSPHFTTFSHPMTIILLNLIKI